MKYRASSTHKMDAPDRHNGQTDKRTCRFVRLSVCVLDGVWHIGDKRTHKFLEFFGRQILNLLVEVFEKLFNAVVNVLRSETSQRRLQRRRSKYTISAGGKGRDI